MLRHGGRREHRGVHRDLVERAREPRLRPPSGVAADPPVPDVGLSLGLGVRAAQHAVDVQLHAVRALRRHEVVPLVVVVGRGRGDRVGSARPRAERQTTVGLHVHVPVVVAARPGVGVAEPDELAAVERVGAEPQLLGVHARVVELHVAGHQARAAVERRRAVRRDAHERAGLVTRDPAAVGARRAQDARVRRGRRQQALVEAPVQVRPLVVHGLAVGVGRGRRERRGAARGHVVLVDALRRERRVVDRHLVDLAVEERRATPGVVAADAPVARVVLRARHVRALRHPLAVQVQLHAVRAERRDEVVPLAVVVRLRRVDRLARAGVDAEVHLAVGRHVDVAVVAAARAGLGAAEAGDLAARVRGRLEPALEREDLRPGHGGLGGREPRGRAVERRRRVRVAVDRAGHAARHAALRHHVVAAGPVQHVRAGVAEAPQVLRLVVEHGLPVGRERLVAHRHGHPRRLRLVAVRVDRADAVPHRRARCQARVDEAHGLALPELPRVRLGVDRRARVGRAEQAVLELLVVAVVVRRPREPHLAALDRRRRQVPVVARERRSHLVGGDVRQREAHQALLRHVVHPRELTAEQHVLARRGDRPRALRLAGVGAGVDRRVPVQDRRRGLAAVVRVAVPVRGVDARGRLGQRGRAVERPRVRLREPARVAAVVLVARRVDDVAQRIRRVGVAVAVLDPRECAGGPVGGERALHVAAAAEVVAGAVERVADGLQAEHRGLCAAVAHLRVDGQREHRAGGGVEARQAVAGVRRSVDAGEGSAEHDRALVGREHQVLHAAAVDRGRQREVGAGRRVDRGEPLTCLPVDRGERAGDVDRGVGGHHRVHGAVRRRLEACHQGARRGVERGEAVAGLSVDARERADGVQARAVGRDGHVLDLRVEVGREAGVERSGGQVVRHHVVADDLVGARGRAGRTCARELAAHVDLVPDGGLVPHHAVDLRGGQAVGGRRHGISRVDRDGVRDRRCGHGQTGRGQRHGSSECHHAGEQRLRHHETSSGPRSQAPTTRCGQATIGATLGVFGHIRTRRNG